MKISEAQIFVKDFINKYNIKKSPLASLAGIMEELSELASIILIKEGFKKGHIKSIGYMLAEILFELLELAEDYDINLEEEFRNAIEIWKGQEPKWIGKE